MDKIIKAFFNVFFSQFIEIINNISFFKKIYILNSRYYHLFFNIHLSNTINNIDKINKIIFQYLDFFELKNIKEITISICLIDIYSKLNYFKEKQNKLKEEAENYFLPKNIIIFFETMNKIIDCILINSFNCTDKKLQGSIFNIIKRDLKTKSKEIITKIDYDVFNKEKIKNLENEFYFKFKYNNLEKIIKNLKDNYCDFDEKVLYERFLYFHFSQHFNFIFYIYLTVNAFGELSILTKNFITFPYKCCIKNNTKYAIKNWYNIKYINEKNIIYDIDKPDIWLFDRLLNHFQIKKFNELALIYLREERFINFLLATDKIIDIEKIIKKNFLK